LKKKYDELVAEKRIRFVTFHQSYGYEEFVEGLRANSDQGQVSYDVEPGIFKQICDQASQGVEPENDPLEKALEQFKVELEESSVLKLKTLRGKEFNVQYHGNNTFRVFPEATIIDDLGKGYAVSIDNIRKLYRDKAFKKFYNPSYVKAILNHLKIHYEIKDFKVPTSGQIKNFVLIIDEINRGNISKIFGELITLIESTKRSGEGQDEALEVVLPNSGDPFTVPNNLYLIGTMNTADRSLAMMDTALRRRFDFVEMMPKPELFNDVIVKEINLELLLSKINQRIEVLYDREHTLGHAFFMPVKALVGDQDRAFNELKAVFKNKIIPLLEEYFFEDWNKIRLVLGDNQKAEDLQFISEEKQSFDSLFGNDHGLNSYQQEEKSYRLLPFDNDVWNSPEAYIGIYKATKEE
jgi:5-methylcytosine-specific restriction protein B